MGCSDNSELVLNNITSLDIDYQGLHFSLSMHSDANLGQVHDVLCMMRNYLIIRMQDQLKLDEVCHVGTGTESKI